MVPIFSSTHKQPLTFEVLDIDTEILGEGVCFLDCVAVRWFGYSENPLNEWVGTENRTVHYEDIGDIRKEHPFPGSIFLNFH